MKCSYPTRSTANSPMREHTHTHTLDVSKVPFEIRIHISTCIFPPYARSEKMTREYIRISVFDFGLDERRWFLRCGKLTLRSFCLSLSLSSYPLVFRIEAIMLFRRLMPLSDCVPASPPDQRKSLVQLKKKNKRNKKLFHFIHTWALGIWSCVCLYAPLHHGWHVCVWSDDGEAT